MKVPCLFIAAAVAASLSGCLGAADYVTPRVATPSVYVAEAKAVSSGDSAGRPVDFRQWWRALRDSELDTLIARAMNANPDLEIALTRVEAARERVLQTAPGALPSVEIVAGGGGGTGSDNTNGRLPSTFRAAENSKGLNSTTEGSGLNLDWDLDLFGRIRSEVEAEKDDAEALEHARDFVYVTVVADVARAYLGLRAEQRELQVLDENIAAAKSTQGLAQSQLDRGLTDALDVTLARRQLATLEAGRAPLVAQIENRRHAIATLLGKFPEDMASELARPGSMPALPAHIPIGIPSQLLRRRPDIAEVERRLAAANARVGAAIASLFPDVSITGAFGQQGGPRADTLVKPAALIWTLGPSVTTPFLDFGALDAQIAIADLQTREILAAYREAILKAVREVDDAGALYAAQQQRIADLDRALTAAREATRLATQRYNVGLTDFLNVLDAERQQFELEQRYVEARAVEAEALVALFEALGGGWPENAPEGNPRRPDIAIVAAAKYLAKSESAH